MGQWVTGVTDEIVKKTKKKLSDCRTIVGSHRIALASGLRDSKIIEAQQGITKWGWTIDFGTRWASQRSWARLSG